MRYCSKCGNEIMDDAVICVKCGCAVEKIKSPNAGLDKAIKVIMVLGTIIMGLYIIPLCWCIPMTVRAFKCINQGKPMSTGFKICSLLFVSLLGGILLLCRNEQNS